MKTYIKEDFERAANELLINFNGIYNGNDTECSALASILCRSYSKWAEYSIKDLCLSPKNFDFIDTTSDKKLGRHNIRFSSILELIHRVENVLPAMSRLKIYTYIDCVTIQFVDNYSIIIHNPYNPYYYNNEDRTFKEDAINSIVEAFSTTKTSTIFKRAKITLTM